MSDALSYSVELAAERSSERYYLEKRLQKSGLYYGLLEHQLKKLGIKGFPSDTLVDSLASLEHDARSILDALVESGYKYYSYKHYNGFGVSDSSLSSAMYLLDAEKDTPNKYVKVFRRLKEKMDYKTVNIADVGEQLYQVDRLFKISRIDGDVCKTIDVLAEIGYRPTKLNSKRWLLYYDVELINYLTKSDTDEFLKAFHKLKEKFKYKSIRNSFGQIDDILAISQVLGYSNAIDTLARTGYKIKKIGITRSDVEEIKHMSDRLWRETLKDFTCLYKNMPGELIRYFQHLSVEDKKAVIKSIFNCDKTSNHAVTTWLDENYPELVREVGLSLV